MTLNHDLGTWSGEASPAACSVQPDDNRSHQLRAPTTPPDILSTVLTVGRDIISCRRRVCSVPCQHCAHDAQLFLRYFDSFRACRTPPPSSGAIPRDRSSGLHRQHSTFQASPGRTAWWLDPEGRCTASDATRDKVRWPPDALRRDCRRCLCGEDNNASPYGLGDYLRRSGSASICSTSMRTSPAQCAIYLKVQLPYQYADDKTGGTIPLSVRRHPVSKRVRQRMAWRRSYANSHSGTQYERRSQRALECAINVMASTPSVGELSASPGRLLRQRGERAISRHKSSNWRR